MQVLSVPLPQHPERRAAGGRARAEKLAAPGRALRSGPKSERPQQEDLMWKLWIGCFST